MRKHVEYFGFVEQHSDFARGSTVNVPLVNVDLVEEQILNNLLKLERVIAFIVKEWFCETYSLRRENVRAVGPESLRTLFGAFKYSNKIS